MKRDITDALFSRFIRLICDATCTRCGKRLGMSSQGLHCAHYHSRGKKSVRFDRDNATALCYGCHSYLDQHKEEKTEFFMNLLGTKRFNALDERARIPAHNQDLEAIRADLRDKIKKLEGTEAFITPWFDSRVEIKYGKTEIKEV